jgi:Xaa-Pro aminopeptidase
MFSAQIYVERRKRLKEQVQSGVVLLLGNDESPMNYTDNCFSFRQDSSFLYYFGLDAPGLTALIDIDGGCEAVFGNDLTVDDIIWTGPKPALRECAQHVGVSDTDTLAGLDERLRKIIQQKRVVHYLPQYRADSVIKMSKWFNIDPSAVHADTSVSLIKAVAAQRSIKAQEEIEQIEAALDIAYETHTAAMRLSQPGMYEREIAGTMEGIALSQGGRLAFPTIFSIHGETLHNHDHSNLMQAGDIAVNDSGVETDLHYASDITRTIPIGGRFTTRQKEIYSIVLDAQLQSIDAIKPGVEYRDIHRLASTVLSSGLKELGLMKGDAEEAVQAGAHTLFFQCGLGHMMGLDVHDMEGLGEDYVGYTDTIKRNPAFGWNCLRLGKELEPGFVITVEPGIYFIPELISRWKADQKCSEFINYDRVEEYVDFGGIRIEDDVLVKDQGCRVLGKCIPKTIAEVEAASS